MSPNDIPDHWPPAEAAPPPDAPVVPLFPLANVWLFPGAVMPLHIFEARYRQMIEESLDATGRMVIGTVQEGHEDRMPGTPPVYPIAGLGEIGRHERLPDGRFLILLVGLTRVHLTEVPSDRGYRRVAVQPVEEHPVAPEREAVLRQRLGEAVLERTNELLNLPDEMPLSALTDLLILRMPLPHQVVRRLYAELDVEQRAELALAEHDQRPKLEERAPAADHGQQDGEGESEDDEIFDLEFELEVEDEAPESGDCDEEEDPPFGAGFDRP